MILKTLRDGLVNRLFHVAQQLQDGQWRLVPFKIVGTKRKTNAEYIKVTASEW